MDTTIIYDAAQKTQVFQPQSGDLSTLALFIGIIATVAVIMFTLHILMKKRVAREYHVVYKRVPQDPPAIQKLRSRVK